MLSCLSKLTAVKEKEGLDFQLPGTFASRVTPAEQYRGKLPVYVTRAHKYSHAGVCQGLDLLSRL